MPSRLSLEEKFSFNRFLATKSVRTLIIGSPITERQRVQIGMALKSMKCGRLSTLVCQTSFALTRELEHYGISGEDVSCNIFILSQRIFFV